MGSVIFFLLIIQQRKKKTVPSPRTNNFPLWPGPAVHLVSSDCVLIVDICLMFLGARWNGQGLGPRGEFRRASTAQGLQGEGEGSRRTSTAQGFALRLGSAQADKRSTGICREKGEGPGGQSTAVAGEREICEPG